MSNVLVCPTFKAVLPRRVVIAYLSMQKLRGVVDFL